MDPHLERLQNGICSAINGLSLQDLSRHPAGKWSAVEILEHLYLTYTGTSKGLSRVLESGEPAPPPTWKQRAQTFVVVGLGYLPSGRQSPVVARPRGLPAQKVVAEVVSKIAEMDAIMTSCETKFGSRAWILDHPVLGPLSIAQWRKFHLVHGLHHLKQMQRLRHSVKEMALHPK